MCQGKFMRPILLACMTQAPWRCLSNKSNPYHLLALYSVSSKHRRDPIKTYRSLCKRWAQISCWIIVGCAEPLMKKLLVVGLLVGDQKGLARGTEVPGSS